MTAATATTTAARIALAGASGTIGQAVARELAAQGHMVIVLSRADLADAKALAARLTTSQAEIVMSCISSRSGSPKDAQAVDFGANAALLRAAQAAGARQFILLSAICVQRPRLAFQHAKLAFEAQLTASDIPHTIIRPTAFFKSLSGQVERVKAGKPFLIFGDGHLTRCKPISDRDLARFIVQAIDNPAMMDKIVPIGGPGPAISLRDQGEMLFRLTGQKARFTSISPYLFTAAARLIGLGAGLSRWCAEKAEYARIAQYYATESMLLIDPATGQYAADLTPEYGSDTLESHYRRLVAAG